MPQEIDYAFTQMVMADSLNSRLQARIAELEYELAGLLGTAASTREQLTAARAATTPLLAALVSAREALEEIDSEYEGWPSVLAALAQLRALTGGES